MTWKCENCEEWNEEYESDLNKQKNKCYECGESRLQ